MKSSRPRGPDRDPVVPDPRAPASPATSGMELLFGPRHYSDVARVSRVVFLLTGIAAALCIPLIFLAEKQGWPQWPMNLTQLACVPTCFVSSAVFLFTTRHLRDELFKGLAWVALALSGLFLALLVAVFTWLFVMNPFPEDF